MLSEKKSKKKLVNANGESKNMTEKTRKSLKLVGTRPRVMYGLCKVHNPSAENCRP